MKKWEYATLAWKPDGVKEKYILRRFINDEYYIEEMGFSQLNALNHVGRDGWEVISKVGFRDDIWLKREVGVVHTGSVKLPYEAVACC